MNGIICLWKKRGLTSHDCVQQLRRLLHTKKVGHAGTLDPTVAGILPICVGQATRLVEYLQAAKKTYTGEITLGFQTETEDLEGEIVAKEAINEPYPDEKIQAAARHLEGELIQIPPMYSAVKVNGKRLYEYARQGLPVTRPKRHVHIDEFLITSPSHYDAHKKQQSFSFQVTCSKGTYIRTLAVQLGQELGTLATMTQLTWIGAGSFSYEDASTLEEIEEQIAAGQTTFLRPMSYALTHFPIWKVPLELQFGVKNGQVLPLEVLPAKLRCQLPVQACFKGKVFGIYKKHPEKPHQIKPEKMFPGGAE